MNRAIVIVGMHRSGTSSLAGVLQKAGVYLGNVSERNLHNPKGNRENPRIMRLHESLLEHNGGTWDDPPAKVVWPDQLKRERDDIVKELGAAPVWGFKDPRSVLVLDGWLEVLPNPSFAGTFRHPSLVARSLLKRNGFQTEKSFRLWYVYNAKLLRYQDQFGFPTVCFDLPGPTYQEKLKQLAGIIGLGVGDGAVEFYSETLKNQIGESDEEVPRELIEVYRRLERRAV